MQTSVNDVVSILLPLAYSLHPSRFFIGGGRTGTGNETTRETGGERTDRGSEQT